VAKAAPGDTLTSFLVTNQELPPCVLVAGLLTIKDCRLSVYTNTSSANAANFVRCALSSFCSTPRSIHVLCGDIAFGDLQRLIDSFVDALGIGIFANIQQPTIIGGQNSSCYLMRA